VSETILNPAPPQNKAGLLTTTEGHSLTYMFRGKSNQIQVSTEILIIMLCCAQRILQHFQSNREKTFHDIKAAQVTSYDP